MSELSTERRTYETSLPSMLREHEGEYVVIQGEELRHFSDSYERALEWAYESFGLNSFFVKRVAEDRDLAHFSRDLGPCPIR